MVSVLLVVTSWDVLGDTGKKTGWSLPEVAYPYDVFKNADFKVTICSPRGGETPIDPESYEKFLGDKVCREFLEDRVAQAKISNSIPVNKIDPTEFQVVFFVGGYGSLWDFPDNKIIQELCTRVYESNGIIAGVAHGVAGLLNVKLSIGEYLVRGKIVTCLTYSEEADLDLKDVLPFTLETALVNRGCIFKTGPSWTANVASIERLMTGQNHQSANLLAELIVDKANELKFGHLK